MSMYNLVPVCVFCAQFFDPDFPGGIAVPNREENKVACSTYESIVKPNSSNTHALATTSQQSSSPPTSKSVSSTAKRPKTSVISYVSSRSPQMVTNVTITRNVSKRGTILAPIKNKSNLNKTGVHLLSKMDTRFDFGNDLGRLGSPEVSKKRERAKKFISIVNDTKQELEKEAALRLKKAIDSEKDLS